MELSNIEIGQLLINGDTLVIITKVLDLGMSIKKWTTLENYLNSLINE